MEYTAKVRRIIKEDLQAKRCKKCNGNLWDIDVQDRLVYIKCILCGTEVLVNLFLKNEWVESNAG